MVLELRIPHGKGIGALRPLIPVFLSYILSFVYIAIYWNNHHHLLHATERINGKILWANMHLLFWISLFPFMTGWMGENDFASTPAAVYGVVLLMAALAWTILQRRRPGSRSASTCSSPRSGWSPIAGSSRRSIGRA